MSARGGVLHLSAGLGTTFVPFRFFARPAAYELVLRTSPRKERSAPSHPAHPGDEPPPGATSYTPERDHRGCRA